MTCIKFILILEIVEINVNSMCFTEGRLDSKAHLAYKHSLGMSRKGQLTFFGNSQKVPLPF